MAAKKIGDIIREALAAGKDTATILALVKAEHPGAQTTSASISWYRSQMKKQGAPASKTKDTGPLRFKAGKNADGGLTLTPTTPAPVSVPAAYEARNIKNINGTQGEGYECTLYRDGKRVAVATDHADGALVHFHWFDSNTSATVHAYNYDGKSRSYLHHSYTGTVEEAMFAAFCKDKGWFESQGMQLHHSMDTVTEDLINDARLLKQLAKLTKKGTRIAFITAKGELYTQTSLPNETEAEAIVRFKKNSPEATVLNGLSPAEAVTLLKKFQH
jgi:hypothetical protein